MRKLCELLNAWVYYDASGKSFSDLYRLKAPADGDKARWVQSIARPIPVFCRGLLVPRNNCGWVQRQPIKANPFARLPAVETSLMVLTWDLPMHVKHSHRRFGCLFAQPASHRRHRTLQ